MQMKRMRIRKPIVMWHRQFACQDPSVGQAYPPLSAGRIKISAPSRTGVPNPPGSDVMRGGHGCEIVRRLPEVGAVSAMAEHGRKIACAVNEVDYLDGVPAYSIDEPIALNEQLADVWIVFFRYDSATLSELPKGSCRIASVPHESRCVSW
jgi:hypothetical protein